MQKFFLICILCVYIIETKLTKDALERILKISDEYSQRYHFNGKSKDPKFQWSQERLLGKKNKKCFLKRPCKTSLPQNASKKCRMESTRDITIARAWYQITTPDTVERKTDFPLKAIPWLNQGVAEAKYYYTVEPFLSRHLNLFSTIIKLSGGARDNLRVKYQDSPFDSVNDFKQVLHDSLNAIKAVQTPQYFDIPFNHPQTITDVIDNNDWMDDDVFSQSFFVNDVPFSVLKVTDSDDVGFKFNKLLSMLNMDDGFDFDDALTNAYGESITMQEAFKKNILFVVHFEQLNGIKAVEDFHKGQTGTSTMDEVTSPITLFVKNKQKELKIAAIQLDYLPTSTVIKPEPGLAWLKAKATVNMARTTVNNGYYHVGHCHLIGAIFCTAFRRHFGRKHPFYESFKHHCEGTTSSMVFSYHNLLFPGGFVAEDFAVGNNGFKNLSQQAWDDRNFGQFDYPTILKKIGIKKKEFNSYPFLEDSELLWNEYTQYTTNLVYTFYDDDSDVANDVEAQSFANEISTKGIIKFTGFPSSFVSREQLANVLRSIFWYNIIHAVINYPLAPTFVPIQPTKLYTDETNEEFLSFGNADHIVGITTMGNALGSLRVNRIMDYYDKVQDRKLQALVWKSYSRLHGCIQKTLQKSNAKRKKNGLPGMQYLEPKWLPNSIHV